ncbi:MAG: hypothetical protein ACI4II_01430 [Acutalibacteraceae bacterium]
MKKIIKITAMAVMLVMVLSMTACSFYTNQTFVYDVTTGDKISLKLKTTGGYTMKSTDLPFQIGTKDTTILQGTFITSDGYDQYVELVNAGEGVTLIKKGEQDGNEYYFYSTDGSSGTELDFIVRIKGTNTGVAMGALESDTITKDVVFKCFEAISFSLAKS